VTVVAWGHGLHRVLALGEGLASVGIEIEIIDPRWLDRASFDRATVLSSVGRTGALVIVEDAMRSHSMGGLILDYLMPDLHALLRSAPRRMTGLDVYSPVSAPLEAHVHLQDSSILEAITAAAAVARTKG
jgi:pyruvate/2-oxoglutarate/acetoin dehydrogenase E1 component